MAGISTLLLVTLLAAAAFPISSARSIADADSRIDATRNQFPYIVAIENDFGYDNITMFICTGAILNERWIIATALCELFSANDLPMIVRVGANDLNDDSHATVYHSKRIVTYGNYTRGDNRTVAGLGLLEVAKPIEFGLHAQPIRVNGNFMAADRSGLTIGFGHTYGDEWSGYVKKHLQYFAVRTVDHTMCPLVTEGAVEFCVWNKRNNDGIVYTGFSAPTVINGELVGVADGWANSKTFWSMIRLSEFVTWIEETIKQ